MSRISFFATSADALSALSRLEDEIDVAYVEENRLERPSPHRWKRAADLPSFGFATGDQEILCAPFLITAKDAEVVVNSSVMTDGKTRYDVYQSNNPESVLLRLGGFWKDGSLISGHMVSSSEQEFARKVMNSLRKSMRRSFTRVGAFWVGPEALALLREGRRLCTAIQSPVEYDLREAKN